MEDFIEVLGAREHNLRNLDLKIPRNQLVVITGLSGSGKSSLAFDTLFAEGQRRYLESFSSYARQFIGNLKSPDVDKVNGLSPVIAIEQKTTSRNPRSTVGTVTEIYDLFRLLFARIGEAYSHLSGNRMVQMSDDQIVETITKNHTGEKVIVLAPLIRGRKGHYRELFSSLLKQGYSKVRIDGDISDIKAGMKLDRYKVHDIELVVDRLAVGTDPKRESKSIQLALQKGNGSILISIHDSDKLFWFSRNLMDPETGLSYDEPSPNTFSFNSPYGACPECNGLGTIYTLDNEGIIIDETVSINRGAVGPIGELRKVWLFDQLRMLAETVGFRLTTPWVELDQLHKDLVLYGLENSDFSKRDFPHGFKFKGVEKLVMEAYRNSESDHVKKWAEEFLSLAVCPACEGARLKPSSLFFKLDGKSISDISSFDLGALGKWMDTLEEKLSPRQITIGNEVLKELRKRIGFLLEVGLDYLSLNRQAKTLSGGEAQRIRLATQIGSQLMDVLYILDEPSIGLHQRDNEKLINSLLKLRDIGNSVIVVEHDKDMMLASDFIIDLGPGAGIHGGKIVAMGTPEEILKSDSSTSGFLNGSLQITIPPKRRKPGKNWLKLIGAKGNNLNDVTLKIPLEVFVCVTGVSGSGKSTIVNETIYPILKQYIYKSRKKPLEYESIEGLDLLDKVIEIDQSPIGRTPRSNPATYTGVFTYIREFYSQLAESKIRGYKPGRFSFNVVGGRCEECKGGGMRSIEMNFLPDVYVECEECQGRRYLRETLEIRYKGKSISDVLDMTVEDGLTFFEAHPRIYRKLKTLSDVGLGYIGLGQPATTLSGGEAQRVKISSELSKRDTGKSIYILDEPTTGLHFQDIEMLLTVLQRLVDRGNTVLVIEHNLDVVKVADYIIDLGPEGGKNGGNIVAEGTPEKVAKVKASHTGRFLKMEFEEYKRLSKKVHG